MRNITPKPSRVPRTQLILITLFAVALITGTLAAFENGRLDWRGLMINLSTEVIGACITYFVIDRIISQNEDEEKLKVRLIREMENPNNGITVRAVQELRTRGWLQDGSLFGWFIQRTNMENVDLRDADLHGFGLYRTSLYNSRINTEQFLTMTDLRLCTMPDGSLYDGRYALRGDIDWAHEKYHLDFNTATVEQMAEYYGVTVKQFIEGQRWALESFPSYGMLIPDCVQRLKNEGAI
jgi:hypothetical protein